MEPAYEILAAVRDGNKSKLRQLKAKHGIDAATSCDRLTALHFAVANGLDDVKVLLEEGADPNATNSDDQTPMFAITLYRGPGNRDAATLDIVKALVAAGADVHHIDRRAKYSILSCACQKGLGSLTEYLITPTEQGGAGAAHLMTLPSIEGFYPYHLAVQGGHAAVIRVLLAHGQDVNQKAQAVALRDAHGPLFPPGLAAPGHPVANMLAEYGHTELLKELVTQHGLRVSDVGVWGSTPLHMAAMEGNSEAVDFLLQHGAQVHAKNMDGRTAAEAAQYFGHTRALDLLNKAAASSNASSSASSSASGSASSSGKKPVVHMSAKELKQELAAAGVDCTACVEKAELQQLLQQTRRKQQQQQQQQQQQREEERASRREQRQERGQLGAQLHAGNPWASDTPAEAALTGTAASLQLRQMMGQGDVTVGQAPGSSSSSSSSRAATAAAVQEFLSIAEQLRQGQQKQQQQQMLEDVRRFCAVCRATPGPSTKLQFCAGCRGVYYCCKAHQRQDWPTHKAACKLLAQSVADEPYELLPLPSCLPATAWQQPPQQITSWQQYAQERLQLDVESYSEQQRPLVRSYLRLTTDDATYALTLGAALLRFGLSAGSPAGEGPLVVHLMGVEACEVQHLGTMMSELSAMWGGRALRVLLVGDEVPGKVSMPAGLDKGRFKLQLYRGLYHDYMRSAAYQPPHLAAAFHVGMYEKPRDRFSWGATLGALAREGVPVLLTEFDEGDLRRLLQGLPEFVVPRARVLWSGANPWASQLWKQVPGQASQMFCANCCWVGLRGLE